MSQGGLVHIRHFPRALFCLCIVPEPSQLDCLVLLFTGYIGRQRAANTSISFLPLLCTPSMVDSTEPANRHQSMDIGKAYGDITSAGVINSIGFVHCVAFV